MLLCYKDAFMVKESMLKSWIRGMWLLFPKMCLSIKIVSFLILYYLHILRAVEHAMITLKSWKYLQNFIKYVTIYKIKIMVII
jgi:hypothetical protein